MDGAQLIEQLSVRIACVFEDGSAILLLGRSASLGDRVAAPRAAVDEAAAIIGAATAIAAGMAPDRLAH